MAIVVPAILENSFAEIEKKIRRIEGLVEWVQIDILDGTLLPNTCFSDPEPFRKYTALDLTTGDAREGSQISVSTDLRRNLGNSSGRTRKLEFEAHLMVKDPLRYVERFSNVGFKRFYAHIEGDYVQEYIAKCYQLGVQVGLAIDGPTPVEKIKEYLDNIDIVLVLAVDAGFSGRPFREDTVEKIKTIHEWEFDLPIAVDGAMDDVNAAKVVAAGATIICSNSYIFKAEDVRIPIERLKQLEEEVRKSN